MQLDSPGDADFELERFVTTLPDVTQISFAYRCGSARADWNQALRCDRIGRHWSRSISAIARVLRRPQQRIAVRRVAIRVAAGTLCQHMERLVYQDPATVIVAAACVCDHQCLGCMRTCTRARTAPPGAAAGRVLAALGELLLATTRAAAPAVAGGLIRERRVQLFMRAATRESRHVLTRQVVRAAVARAVNMSRSALKNHGSATARGPHTKSTPLESRLA